MLTISINFGHVHYYIRNVKCSDVMNTTVDKQAIFKVMALAQEKRLLVYHTHFFLNSKGSHQKNHLGDNEV